MESFPHFCKNSGIDVLSEHLFILKVVLIILGLK